MKDQPLIVEIKDDEIVIRVGIDVVKWALEHHEDAQPYNEETGEYDQKWIVSDQLEFANDVRRSMDREEEDGTTPLIEFIDKMCIAALEDGSIGVEDAPKGTRAFDA
jgi:hypothetical protein